MNWSAALDSVSTSAHEAEIVLRLGFAAAVAGLIGWERESRGRAAGLRTHILTALAAVVFTILAFEIYHGHGRSGDPIRIIEAVTAGVAFLAAGAIIQSRGEVQGLTTGASMWMAGALGVACGAGHYALAVIAAVAAFLVLRVLGWLEAHAAMNGNEEGKGDLQAKSGQPGR